jgi:antitoxin component of MazEF toxin-antitoxin module
MSTLIAKTEVKEWGNSLAVRIPKKIKEALSLRDGSHVNISLEGNKVILESEENPFFDLSKDMNLLAVVGKITSKNKHSSDEGEAVDVVGQEVW